MNRPNIYKTLYDNASNQSPLSEKTGAAIVRELAEIRNKDNSHIEALEKDIKELYRREWILRRAVNHYTDKLDESNSRFSHLIIIQGCAIITLAGALITLLR